ncbi:MAG: hypothetical protein ACKE51_01895, partial [Methylococcaceae bacterium]
MFQEFIEITVTIIGYDRQALEEELWINYNFITIDRYNLLSHTYHLILPSRRELEGILTFQCLEYGISNIFCHMLITITISCDSCC